MTTQTDPVTTENPITETTTSATNTYTERTNTWYPQTEREDDYVGMNMVNVGNTYDEISRYRKSIVRRLDKWDTSHSYHINDIYIPYGLEYYYNTQTYAPLRVSLKPEYYYTVVGFSDFFGRIKADR